MDNDNGQGSVAVAVAEGPAVLAKPANAIAASWTYRSYQTTYPCANLLLQKKWDIAAQQDHILKIKSVKASIDNKEPKRYSHLVSQARKRRAQYDYAMKLNSENKNLLERIRRQVLSNSDKIKTINSDDKSLSGQNKPKTHGFDRVIRTHGLNGPRKLKLRQQMEQENEILLQRLEASVPHYNKSTFNQDRKKTLVYLQNISRFPLKYVEEYLEDPTPPTSSSGARSTSALSIRRTPPYRLPRPTTAAKSRRAMSAPSAKPTVQLKPLPSNTSIQPVKGEAGYPKRWAPSSPLVPRVANLRSKSATSRQQKTLPQPQQQKQQHEQQQRSLSSHHHDGSNSGSSQKRVTYDTQSHPSQPIHPRPYDVDVGKIAFEDKYEGWDDWVDEGVPEDWTGLVGVSVTGERGDVVWGRQHKTGSIITSSGSGSGAGKDLERKRGTVIKVLALAADGVQEQLRRVFIDSKLPQLREYCRQRGVEFQYIDVGLSIQAKSLLNSLEAKLAYYWIMDKTLKESASINTIAFVRTDKSHSSDTKAPTKYWKLLDSDDIGFVPFQLDEKLFTMILKCLRRTNPAITEETEDFAKAFESFYSLDAMFNPPRYTLNESGVNFGLLKKIVTIAAVRLARKKKITPHFAQQLFQSQLQHDLLRTVVKQAKSGKWERSLLVSASVSPLEQKATAQESEAVNLSVLYSRALIKELNCSVPLENKISLTSEDGSDENELARISSVFEERLEKSIRHMSFDSMDEEIYVHTSFLHQHAQDHWQREHLYEHIIDYLWRIEPHSVPPFLLTGSASTGKLALLGKLVEQVKLKLENSSSGSDIKRENGVSAKTWKQKSSKFLASALYEEDILIRQSFYATEGAVILARVVGLTPLSSTSRGLMQSMTDQLNHSFGIPKRVMKRCLAQGDGGDTDDALAQYGTEDSNHNKILQQTDSDANVLRRFKLALGYAEIYKPIFIVLGNFDRLPLEGNMCEPLSWLLHNIPPFVRIVLASETDTRMAKAVEDRISYLAPETLAASVRASGSEVPPSKIQNDLAISDCKLTVTGGMITPVLKSYIKRLEELDGRKLKMEEEAAIRHGFETAEKETNSGGGIRLAKLLYSFSRTWKVDSWKSFVFPSSLHAALGLFLDQLETKHGKDLVRSVLSSLVISKSGLTLTELEGIAIHPKNEIDINVSSSIRFLAYDLREVLVSRNAWGGEILSISSDQALVNAITSRYLATQDEVQASRTRLCEFFQNNSGDLFYTLPNGYISWNQRKLDETLFALSRLGEWDDLGKFIQSNDTLISMIGAYGDRGTLRVLQDIITYGFSCEDQTISEDCFNVLKEALSGVLCLIPLADKTPSALFMETFLRVFPHCSISSKLKENRARKMITTLPEWTECRIANMPCRPTEEIIPDKAVTHASPPSAQNGFVESKYHIIHDGSDVKCYDSVWQPSLVQSSASVYHSELTCVAVSPDGRYVATAGAQRTIKLFDNQTAVELAVYTIPDNNNHSGSSTSSNTETSYISCMDFEPNSENCAYLVFAVSGQISIETKLILWSMTQELITTTITGKKVSLNAPLVACGLVADEHGNTHARAFGFSAASALTIWDIESNTMLIHIRQDQEDAALFPCGTARASKDGTQILFGNSSLKLLDMTSLSIVWCMSLDWGDKRFQTFSLTNICFDEMGLTAYITSTCDEKRQENDCVVSSSFLCEINMRGQSMRPIAKLPQSATGLALSPQEDNIYVSNLGGFVYLYNISDGEILASETTNGPVISMLSLPNLSAEITEKYPGCYCPASDSISSIPRLVLGFNSGVVQMGEFQTGGLVSTASSGYPATETGCFTHDGSYFIKIERIMSNGRFGLSAERQELVLESCRQQNPSFAFLKDIIWSVRAEKVEKAQMNNKKAANGSNSKLNQQKGGVVIGTIRRASSVIAHGARRASSLLRSKDTVPNKRQISISSPDDDNREESHNTVNLNITTGPLLKKNEVLAPFRAGPAPLSRRGSIMMPQSDHVENNHNNNSTLMPVRPSNSRRPSLDVSGFAKLNMSASVSVGSGPAAPVSGPASGRGGGKSGDVISVIQNHYQFSMTTTQNDTTTDEAIDVNGESSIISVWNVGTGRRVSAIRAPGSHIWCDIDAESHAIMTADRSGKLYKWNWADVLENFTDDKKVKRLVTDRCSIVALERTLFGDTSSGREKSLATGYLYHPNTGVLAVCSTDNNLKQKDSSLIEFWDLETMSKLEHLNITVSAIGRMTGPLASPTVAMSWSQKSAPQEDPASSSSRSSILLAGPSRVFISSLHKGKELFEFDESLQSFLMAEGIISPAGSYLRGCSASTHSRENERDVVFTAFGHDIYCILNDERAVPSTKTVTTAGPSKSFSSSPISVNSSVIPPKVSNTSTGVVPEGSAVVEKSVLHHGRRRNIIRIQSLGLERVIHLSHLCSGSTNALVSVTDQGTLTVYNLSDTLLAKTETRHDENVTSVDQQQKVIKPKVVAVWHMRTAAVGASVRLSSKGTDESNRNKWLLAVWGYGRSLTLLEVVI